MRKDGRFEFRDERGMRKSIYRHKIRAVTETTWGRRPRCGSFPLMNLAEDHGVDYGDVLLVADYYRRLLQNDNTSERRHLADVAYMHIQDVKGVGPAERLFENIRQMARRRWG